MIRGGPPAACFHAMTAGASSAEAKPAAIPRRNRPEESRGNAPGPPEGKPAGIVGGADGDAATTDRSQPGQPRRRAFRARSGYILLWAI